MVISNETLVPDRVGNIELNWHIHVTASQVIESRDMLPQTGYCMRCSYITNNSLCNWLRDFNCRHINADWGAETVAFAFCYIVFEFIPYSLLGSSSRRELLTSTQLNSTPDAWRPHFALLSSPDEVRLQKSPLVIFVTSCLLISDRHGHRHISNYLSPSRK